MASEEHLEWLDSLPCEVTVCDKDFKILYMNDKATAKRAKYGGKALIGKNLMDYHPPGAKETIKGIMASGQPNVYTTEKKGARKLKYQAQWKRNGEVAGLVYFSIELPSDMENIVKG
jgi:PAS domain-containing protein